jgi:nitric oxide synthase-interacting protein
MVKHSKSAASAPLLTAAERRTQGEQGLGTQYARIGTLSQLPFGYCSLSNKPTDGDAVATKSGRIYSREAILEYILQQKKVLRERQYEMVRQERVSTDRSMLEKRRIEENDKVRFREQQLTSTIKSAAHMSAELVANEREASGAYKDDAKRRRLIDDSTDEERHRALQKVSPWLPSSTPAAETALVVQGRSAANDSGTRKEERPLSPFSKTALRVKDLIPLNLQRDSDEGRGQDTVVRYQCHVTRKPISSQRVVVLLPSGVVMLEEAAQTLAYSEGRCPLTGKKFKRDEVLELRPAATGFSGSGNVESKKYRVTMN